MKGLGAMSVAKLTYIAIVLIVLVLIIPLASAFLFSVTKISNVFTVGENISYIEERFGEYTILTGRMEYEKQVAVRNTGNTDCYVRLFAEMEDPEMEKNISVNYDNTTWTSKQPDGFYYYRKKLLPGEKTAPLFSSLKPSMDISDFRMIVYGETVQTEGAADAIKAFEMLK